MSQSVIKGLSNNWVSETLATMSYGTLTGYLNEELKMAYVTWNGTSVSPGSGEKIFNIPSKFSARSQLTVPMRNGDRLTVNTNDTISITFTNQAWSGAAVMYPIA